MGCADLNKVQDPDHNTSIYIVNDSGNKIQVEYRKMLWDLEQHDSLDSSISYIPTDSSRFAYIDINDTFTVECNSKNNSSKGPRSVVELLKVFEFDKNEKYIGNAVISLKDSNWQNRKSESGEEWFYTYKHKNNDTSQEYSALFEGNSPVNNSINGYFDIISANVIISNHFIVCTLKLREPIPDSLNFNDPNVFFASQEYLWEAEIYNLPSDSFKTYGLELSHVVYDSTLYFGAVKSNLSSTFLTPSGVRSWSAYWIPTIIEKDLIILKTDTSWNYSFLDAIFLGKVDAGVYRYIGCKDFLHLNRIRVDTIDSQ